MTTSFKNFALQAAAIFAMTGLLGAVLFTVADYATRGVVA